MKPQPTSGNLNSNGAPSRRFPRGKTGGSRAISVWVALRVALMPRPGTGHDLFQFRKFWSPCQILHRSLGGGNQPGRVARAPRFFHCRNLLAGHLFTSLDHLAHRITVSVAEIVKTL